MNVRWLLFGDSEDTTEETEDERPPKPDDRTETEVFTPTQYTVEFEFRNGETETRECLGYERGESQFTIKTGLESEVAFGERRERVTYTTDTINYETLAREPVVAKDGEARYRVEWHVTHDWSTRGSMSYNLQWVERAVITDIERLEADE